MTAATLIDLLDGYTELSPAFRTAVLACATSERYLTHQVIQAAGQIEQRVWFVSEGLLRRYYFDDNGREHTTGFYREGDVVFSYEGFQKLPVHHYTETLEASVLFALTYQQITDDLNSFRETQVLKEVFMYQRERAERARMQALTRPAEVRYQMLRREQAWLFGRIPLRLIANYLNMTRENLSRLISKDH